MAADHPFTQAPEAGEAAPVPMREQMDAILGWCRQLSGQHRLPLPPEMVRERIQGLARSAVELFQDRVIEICFLLDQFGTLRYNELRRHLGSVSTRTLALKLSFLQQEGLVVRTLFDENPPRVEYRLSARGRQFTELVFPTLVHIAGRPPRAGAE